MNEKADIIRQKVNEKAHIFRKVKRKLQYSTPVEKADKFRRNVNGKTNIFCYIPTASE
jgi:hypothetical protein